MSLILEALRKSEAERRRGTPPQLLDPPLAPSAPSHAPAAPRRIPPAGVASIATAIVVLLGMTGYRMFVSAADDEGASAPAVAAVGPAAGMDPTAPGASTEPASSRAAMQAPGAAAAQASGAMPPSQHAAPDTNDAAGAAAASAAIPPATAARATDAVEGLDPTQSTTPAAAAARPAMPRPRDSASGSPLAAGTTTLSAPTRSAPAAASASASTPRSSESLDRTSSVSGTAPSRPAAPDRAADLARATTMPARGPDRALPSAAAPPAGDRPVRLADLAPADRRALPPLRMSMHLFSAAPAERFVILDGQRVGEGDRVGEAVVDEITADGAVLAWRGQRVWVSVR